MGEVGTEDQRYRLIRTLEQDAGSFGLCASGGAVVRWALAYAAEEDKIWIARAVAQEPQVLLSLATGRHGSVAIVQVLQTLRNQERARARAFLLEHVGAPG